MDQELIAYLDQRFGALDQRLKDLRWEMNQRFERVDSRFNKLEEIVHLSQVTVEGLRGELLLVAEGMMGLSDQMEQTSAEELKRRVVILEERAARETRDILDVVREKYGFAQSG
jgi:hypothetical protein